MRDWVERHLRAQSDHAVRRGTIDMDSFPMEVFGDQPGAAYNGYYGKNGFIHAILRRGNAHTAERSLRFLDRVLELAPRLAYVYDLRLVVARTQKGTAAGLASSDV